MARIDLQAIAENYRRLRGLLADRVGVIAVIKADAYGHGAVPVARHLEGMGVWGFGVATVEEGIELRSAGIRLPIVIMGASFGNLHEEVIERRFVPMIGDPADLELFAASARALDQVFFSVHVKVDTGMSRLGVLPEQLREFVQLAAKYPSIRLDGFATHFACAEMTDRTATEFQLERFRAALRTVRQLGAEPQVIHAANSAAILNYPEAHFDLVRPGLLLYGARPSDALAAEPFSTVMSLYSRIQALREIPKGGSVGYGALWTADRKSKIATIPVGYADGYPRSLTNRASVLIRGQRAPIVGSVCMDLTMVDVTQISDVKLGDTVTLLGGEGPNAIHLEEVARWANRIPYEILVGISKRVPRIYPDIEAGHVG